MLSPKGPPLTAFAFLKTWHCSCNDLSQERMASLIYILLSLIMCIPIWRRSKAYWVQHGSMSSVFIDSYAESHSSQLTICKFLVGPSFIWRKIFSEAEPWLFHFQPDMDFIMDKHRQSASFPSNRINVQTLPYSVILLKTILPTWVSLTRVEPTLFSNLSWLLKTKHNFVLF